MGTKFSEVVCGKSGIGGNGEIFGESNVHLDRTSVLLASHTNGPGDVPRCGALNLLQKPLHYRGIQQISPQG
jgi:hypothetical protein